MKYEQRDIDDAVAAILNKNLVAGTVRVSHRNQPAPQRALTHAEQNADWVRVYSVDFPYVITANISALMDDQARDWLAQHVGEVGVGYRIVTDYPTDQQDTYCFKNEQHALWFKLSFS